MGTIYKIEVIGNISTVATLIAVLSVIVTLYYIVGVHAVETNSSNGLLEEYKRRARVFGILSILMMLVAVMTPSEKVMYEIYGIGGVIDSLRERGRELQLSDDVVKALDKWAEEQIEEENNK